MYFLTIFAVIIGILLTYVKWLQTYWKRKKIPHLEPSFLFGNFGIPIIGNSKRSMPTCVQELYRKLKEKGLKCGGIYAYFAPMFVTVDPEYNNHILVKDFHDFHMRGFYSNKKDQPVSLNLFTSEGEDWRKLRVKFTPTFTTAKMKTMFDLMMEVAKSMDDYFRENVMSKIPINARQCAGYYSMDIVATCAFGLDNNSFKNSTFSDMLEDLVHDSFRYAKISFCLAFPKLANFLCIPLLEKRQTKYICDLLDKTMKNRREDNIVRKDFLQIILELRRQNEINDTESKGQCLLFLIAGFETTSMIFTFALFELAVNEDIQDKLRIQINEILDKYGGEITYEAINAMKYLEMFISEVLRKYPPVPILNRTSVADIKLPNTDFIIEQGTKIVIPIMGLHHDPEYFPNPDKFDPDRFSIENTPNIKPHTYIPFGEGPRGCIGERFGKQSLKVGLSVIIKKYRLTLNSRVKLPLDFESSITLAPATDILLDVKEVNQIA